MKKLFVICLMFVSFNVFGQEVNYPLLSFTIINSSYLTDNEIDELSLKRDVAFIDVLLKHTDTLLIQCINFEDDVLKKKLSNKNYKIYTEYRVVDNINTDIDSKLYFKKEIKKILLKKYSEQQLNLFKERQEKMWRTHRKLYFLSVCDKKQVFSIFNEQYLKLYSNNNIDITLFRIFDFSN